MNIGAVNITHSGYQSSTAGGNATLVCSAIIEPQPNTSRPHFEWFIGPRNNSLPFQTPTTTNNGNTYSSTLQFSPLNQSYAGMYTCRLGGNARLAARTMLTIDGMLLSMNTIL